MGNMNAEIEVVPGADIRITRSREVLVDARSRLKKLIHQSLATCYIKARRLSLIHLANPIDIERLLEGMTIIHSVS